jgi:hypothetical protein
MTPAAQKLSVLELRTRALLLSGIFLAFLLGGIALKADSAQAVEIYEFSASPSLTQAGGHPDLTIKYAGESSAVVRTKDPCQCNEPKNLTISLPAGFIGNPHATPQCKAADFARDRCPADSRIGTLDITVDIGFGLVYNFPAQPVYNIVPRPNQAGLIGVKILGGIFGLTIYNVLAARTGSDYGLDIRTEGLSRITPVVNFTYVLWGVPADDSHTPERGVPSNSPLTPFLQNPSTCEVSASSTIHIIGYDGSVSSAAAPWPTSTGCDQLSFNPSLSARPTTTQTDAPSGVDVDLTVPQLLSPTFPSPSGIKAATVTLPVGFSLNPNAADGKTSCSDGAARFGTEDAAQCPEYSKVGTVTLDSSALPLPIPGAIYIGDPLPNDRYRIILTADGFATHIKILGSIKPDPQTGQVVISFANLPQAPLTRFNTHFFGAERGALATPTQCGTYPVKSVFVPWDEELSNQSSTQFFTIDSAPGGKPCPGASRPFNPDFEASSIDNTAGGNTSFTINLTRDDGDQNLSALNVITPPGLTASLAGIPYCSNAALALAARSSYTGIQEQLDPSCPVTSRVGTAVASAGAGTRPVYLPGKVYLAGPYKGAPFSLAVITPAVSGPYDLGNVVVRAAVKVNSKDAHVTTISDPLPLIFEGIPLRLRMVKVSLDRDQFVLNPTNCDPFQVDAAILGDQGAQANLTSHYQVANCAILGFTPNLTMKLTGGVRRRGHPAIHAVLTSRPGDANLKRISVTLPKGELLDNSNIGEVCPRVRFANDACPASSRLGRAVVTTPLLDQPLSGPIYLRTSDHDLPDLALDLEGQVDFEAAARVDSVAGRLRTVFETVPDVPVSRIVVDLAGGDKGLVQNSEALCGSGKRAAVRMTGQNGATSSVRTKLEVSCGSAPLKKRHGGHRKPLRLAEEVR